MTFDSEQVAQSNVQESSEEESEDVSVEIDGINELFRQEYGDEEQEEDEEFDLDAEEENNTQVAEEDTVEIIVPGRVQQSSDDE